MTLPAKLWCADELARCLAARCLAGGQGLEARQRGDYDLNPDFAQDHRDRPDLRPASVLVPITVRDDGPAIILTRRSERLSAHAGQISFPGGRRDPRDVDDQATALREAHEEIGLSPGDVRLVGRLDTYVTRTGFRITPYVGWVADAFQPRPQPEEVSAVFDLPLRVVLDEGLPQCHTRKVAGQDRRYYVFPYEGWYIWGATAGMLLNLRETLLGPEPGRATETEPERPR